MRDVAGLPWLTFNIFSMPGLVLVTVLHTFPFVYLLASSALHVGRRLLRGGGADPRRQQAAHRAVDHRAAGRAGDPVGHAARLRQCASRCSARRRSSGCPAASSRCRRASTRCSTIRRNTGSPPRCRWCFVLITVVALYLQRAFLARRSYVTLGGKGSRPQLMRARPVRAGCCSASSSLIFIVSIVAPYATLIAVSFSKSWGLEFWKGLTLAQLQVHPVRLQRHPARDPQQPDAGGRGGDASR